MSLLEKNGEMYTRERKREEEKKGKWRRENDRFLNEESSVCVFFFYFFLNDVIVLGKGNGVYYKGQNNDGLQFPITHYLT